MTFNKTNANILDLDVFIHRDKKIPCRIIIEKVSENDYQKRLKIAQTQAKCSHTQVRDLHKIKMKYNTLITNID